MTRFGEMLRRLRRSLLGSEPVDQRVVSQRYEPASQFDNENAEALESRSGPQQTTVSTKEEQEEIPTEEEEDRRNPDQAILRISQGHRSKSTQRDPYIIQIGLDFGTSYSKCIWRDINHETASVYVPDVSISDEFPFLAPHKNLCTRSGSGSLPRQWYRAVI